MSCSESVKLCVFFIYVHFSQHLRYVLLYFLHLLLPYRFFSLCSQLKGVLVNFLMFLLMIPFCHTIVDSLISSLLFWMGSVSGFTPASSVLALSIHKMCHIVTQSWISSLFGNSTVSTSLFMCLSSLSGLSGF